MNRLTSPKICGGSYAGLQNTTCSQPDLYLRTALPPGSNRRSRPWAILTPDGRKRIWDSESELPVLPGKILRTGYMPLSELGQALDQKQLDEITKTGWIRVEERIARPKISLKRRRLPELLDPAGAISPEPRKSFEPTPAQHEAISKINRGIIRRRISFFSSLRRYRFR